jgi:hypothetical protein
MSAHYILIDYQNVQPKRLTHDPHERLMVFLGSNQSEISARKRLGNDVEYIKMAGEGRNALDFHIAFYVGELLTKEPESQVWIVSKDTGFRPLVQHLTDRKFRIQRVPDLSLVQSTTGRPESASVDSPKVDSERLAAIERHLAVAHPRRLRALCNYLRTHLTPKRAEICAYVQALQKRRIVTLDADKVSYTARE